MVSGSMTLDDKEVIAMLDRLNGPEVKKAAIEALRKGGNVLKKQTDANFKATGIRMKTRNKVTIKKKDGKKKTKIRRIATVKVIKKDLMVKVHIMSDYRVKWFEKGTTERHTKGYSYRNNSNKVRKKVGRWGFVYNRKGKGRRTGRIGAKWFFRDAQSQTESKIFNDINKYLSSAIVKIANKKGGI